MKGDFSRITGLKAQIKHYNQIFQQQGRVQLDSDWNEFNTIISHQRQARTVDVIGQHGAPKHHGGFEIFYHSSLNNDFLISTGHFYAGGLLCETTPSSKLPVIAFPSNQSVQVNDLKIDGVSLEVNQWLHIFTDETPEGIITQIAGIDDSVNEITLVEDLSSLNVATQHHPQLRRLLLYSEQVDFPNPPTLPELPTGGRTDLIYLDVWERHITSLEDAELREVALGGPDTDTRSKVIAQVKIFPDVGAINCEDHITDWEDHIAPANGRLTTRLVEPDTGITPCELGESGGYLGLENRLYRVEIHESGTIAGGATFKWSRSNAAQVYAISEFLPETGGQVFQIRLSQRGKDNFLKIKEDDYIEISNEERDLDTTQAGIIAKVVKVTDTLLELDSDVSMFMGGTLAKIRRWDISNAMTEGLTAISDGPIFQLEDRIEIEFSGTDFKAGDYWVFTARTLTGTIDLLEQAAPLGIRHHYCKLALLKLENSTDPVEDCRPSFPPLTNICAEDVCFDNQNCHFPQADNVQQALDLLCAADDLRLHHKLMHGFGVVCGLKVKCEPNVVMSDTPGRMIRIEKGYALDCEGNILRIKNENGLAYDLVANAIEQNLLDDNGNGTVCLTIGQAHLNATHNNNTSMIQIEAFEKKDFWDEILQGSLLKDFYEECIEKVICFIGEKMWPFPLKDEAPISLKQRRFTAFINLLFQLFNNNNGRYIYLSGRRDIGRQDRKCGDGSNELRYEDKMLWCCFRELRNLIASETFCGMFDNDRPFPDYDIDPGLETIFGPTLQVHHKLRLHPSRPFAYTSGFNNKIYVYHLEEKREFIQAIEFPGSVKTPIQDIAVSPSGKVLYAVTIEEDKDSVFAVADIDNDSGELKWRGTSIECDLKFVSLAISSSNDLYAVAKGEERGLFRISGIGSTSFLSDQLYRYNATGLLYVSPEKNEIFVAVNDNDTLEEPSIFNQIYHHNLGNPTRIYSFDGNNFDNDMLVHNDTLYVTGNGKDGQRVLGHLNIRGDQDTFNTITLDSDSYLRLAVSPSVGGQQFLLITVADQFKVIRVHIPEHQIDTRFRIPVQVFPMDIAVNNKGDKAYALNMIVNTLTEIDLAQVLNTNPAPDFTMEPPLNLATYREEVLEAYSDLFSHLLQYLKDCFCEKFLIDCPECGPEDKVYLGCVDIRNGQVYNICNFTKRKYVKSFPTLEYWLSTVPMMPILKKAFTQFCCAILETGNKRTKGDFTINDFVQ